MFEDDDFEIDEEFLDGVFDAEKTANGCCPTQNAKSSESDINVVESPVRKRRLCAEDAVSSGSSEETTHTTRKSSDSTITSKPLQTKFKQNFPYFAESEFFKSSPDVPVTKTGVCNDRNASASLVSKASTKGTLSCQENRISLDNGRNDAFKAKSSRSPNVYTTESTSSMCKGRKGEQLGCPSTSVSAGRVRQRKFPGPAGLLPDRTQRMHIHSGFEMPLNDIEDPIEPLCSQSALSVLEDGPWSTLQMDLAPEGRKLLDHYTIAWIKRKAAARQLHGQKVPFLAAVVHSLDCSSPDPCVVFRDTTGEIPGTLHRSVWDSFGGQLVVGSAIVLRLVGVLSTGISARRHYLNITDNNIVTIYSSSLDDTHLNLDVSSRGIRKTDVHKWTLNQILQTVNNWEEETQKKRDNPRCISNATNNFYNKEKFVTSSIATPHDHSVPDSPGQSRSLSVVSPAQPRQILQPQSQVQSNTQKSNFFQTIGPISNSYRENNTLKPLESTSAHNIDKPTFFMSSHFKEPNSTGSTSTKQSSSGRFVPKKPSFSASAEPNDSLSESQKSSEFEVSINNDMSDKSFLCDNRSSIFSGGDDLDISSVLDGIDSESLFGEF